MKPHRLSGASRTLIVLGVNSKLSRTPMQDVATDAAQEPFKFMDKTWCGPAIGWRKL